MKPITVNISYGNTIPNIPVIKNNLKAKLTQNELAYAKEIANEFLTKTLISKTFLDAVSTSKDTIISRSFAVKHVDVTINKYILEYAALTIFAHLYIDDSCPESFDILLGFKCTEGVASDPALQEFVKGPANNIFVITFGTRVD